MRNLNRRRFWSLLKWEITTQRHHLLGFTVGSMIFYLIIGLLIWLLLPSFDPRPMNSILTTMDDSLTSLSIGATVLLPSFLLSRVNKKGILTQYLMLPASRIEKFVARYLMVVVGYMVCWVVGYFVMDVLQYLLTLLIAPDQAVFSAPVVNAAIHGGKFPAWISFLLCLWFWCHSVFLWGGVFFRKHPFIFTSLSFSLISLIVILSVHYLCLAFDVPYASFEQFVFGHAMTNLLLLAFAVFNFIAAYRRFTRIQVTNPQLFNK